MKKRLLASILSATMLLGLMSCSAPAETTTSTSSGSEATSSTETIVMRLGHGNGTSENDTANIMANKFKELVAEYSDGVIQIDIYPASQLGDEVELFGSAGLGDLDFAWGAVPNFTSYAPIMSFAIMPYLFTDIESARGFFNDNLDYLNSYVIEQANSRILAAPIPCFRELFTIEPVESLADMSGLKVRVPPTDIMIKGYEALGASPQVVAWAETYTALEQGVAEGVDNSYSALLDNKLGEVTKYVTDTHLMIQPLILVMSEDVFQDLSPELQEAITRAGKEIAEYYVQVTDELEPTHIKTSEDEQGVTFLGEPDDLEDWIEAGRTCWDECYAQVGGGDADAGKEIVDYIMSVTG